MGYIEGVCAVNRAKLRVGASYVFGAKPGKGSKALTPTDCSGLVTVAFQEAGLGIVDGAAAQWKACRPCTASQAANIPGALCFWRDKPGARISHVAISTGQHHTVEATPPRVVVRHINARSWTCYGLPKCLYG